MIFLIGLLFLGGILDIGKARGFDVLEGFFVSWSEFLGKEEV
jgi:hypothetical protein